MQCHETIELFTRYRDGDLDAATRREVETHLASCAHCREEFAAIDAVVASLHELKPEPLPATLPVAIRSRLHAPAERPRAVLVRWALPTAAAAALVVVVFGVLQVTQRAQERHDLAMSTSAPRTAEQPSAPALERSIGQRSRTTPHAMRGRAPAALAPAQRTDETGIPSRVVPFQGYSGSRPPFAAPPRGRTPAPRAAASKGGAAGPRTPLYGQGTTPTDEEGGRRRAAQVPSAPTLGAHVVPPGPAASSPTPTIQPTPAEAKPSPAVSTWSASRSATEPPKPAPAGPPGPAGPAGPTGATHALEAGRAAPPAAPEALKQKAGAAVRESLPPQAGSGVAGAQQEPGKAPSVLEARRPLSVRVDVTAQASRSQRAAGDLTLQLRTDQEIPEAQVMVRPMQPGARETLVWQGRIDKDVANNVDVRIWQHPWMPSGTQQLTVTSPRTLAQTYYLFLPRAAGMGRGGGGHFERVRPPAVTPTGHIWHTVLQNLANRNDAYVLAPAGFPVTKRAEVEADAPEKDVTEALGRAGYSLRSQEGVITIEPVGPRSGSKHETPPPRRQRAPVRGRRGRA